MAAAHARGDDRAVLALANALAKNHELAAKLMEAAAGRKKED
ncbi:hypothetical protein [Oleisolibacter albus]|nr:hypothetical protein [Oleisolibacter albus]